MKFKFDFRLYESLNWLGIIPVTIFIIFSYSFMEWLFLITKPSFMSSLSLSEQVSIFFVAACFLTIIYLIIVSFFILLSHKFGRSLKKQLVFVSLFIPTFLVACLLIILIDNFTYTIFQFGIISSNGFWRFLYGFIFMFLLFISFKEISKFIQTFQNFLTKFNERNSKFFFYAFVIILAFVGILPVLKNTLQTRSLTNTNQISKSPHIILITVDGVNADNMSLYGYERKTTPFLDTIAIDSLVAQNAFTNAANTSGSIISIFTGKYPIDTKVLYPPDILRSDDAYQHLPAILKLNGYKTTQYSFGFYVDAYQLNMQNGFDFANGRSYESSFLRRINKHLPNNMGFFIYEISNRIFDRLLHIFFVRQMTNPLKEVSSPDNFQDMYKFDSVLDFIDNSETPVFAHIHWMGTHGSKFFPDFQVFSNGQDPAYQVGWDLDLYDDSILNFDKAVENFYNALNLRDLIEDTIIIIASDHGQKFDTDKRLPLIIRFPNADYHKNIIVNVQNIDIAPTILDYLGLTKLDWMVGDSLINEISNNRPIFSVGVGNVDFDEGKIVTQSIQPPFYQFGFVSAIICDTRYKLDLANFSLTEGEIPNYVGECTQENPTQAEVIELFIEFIDAYGYDTSSLREILQ